MIDDIFNLPFFQPKKPISREDYACLLARYYALCLGNKSSIYKEHLELEKRVINDYMNQVECLENEVVERVRELCPESDWDKDIRAVTNEALDALKKNDLDALRKLTPKLQLFNSPDWQERLKLEKNLDG